MISVNILLLLTLTGQTPNVVESQPSIVKAVYVQMDERLNEQPVQENKPPSKGNLDPSIMRPYLVISQEDKELQKKVDYHKLNFRVMHPWLYYPVVILKEKPATQDGAEIGTDYTVLCDQRQEMLWGDTKDHRMPGVKVLKVEELSEFESLGTYGNSFRTMQDQKAIPKESMYDMLITVRHYNSYTRPTISQLAKKWDGLREWIYVGPDMAQYVDIKTGEKRHPLDTLVNVGEVMTGLDNLRNPPKSPFDIFEERLKKAEELGSKQSSIEKCWEYKKEQPQDILLSCGDESPFPYTINEWGVKLYDIPGRSINEMIYNFETRTGQDPAGYWDAFGLDGFEGPWSEDATWNNLLPRTDSDPKSVGDPAKMGHGMFGRYSEDSDNRLWYSEYRRYKEIDQMNKVMDKVLKQHSNPFSYVEKRLPVSKDWSKADVDMGEVLNTNPKDVSCPAGTIIKDKSGSLPGSSE